MNSLGRGDDKKEKNKASVMTRETVGMTILLFGAILFLIAVTGPYIFGDPGTAITAFFLGLFGLFFYPLDLLFVYFGFVLVSGKKPIPGKWLARFVLVALSVFLIVHLSTAERFASEGYGGYLSGCWSAAGTHAGEGTGGGVLMGLIVYPVRKLFHAAGAYVVFSLVLIAAVFFLLMGTPLKGLIFRARAPRAQKTEETRPPVTFEDLSAPAYHEAVPEPLPEERYVPQRAPSARRSVQEESREILFSSDPASSYRNNLIFSSDSQFNNSPRRSSVTRTAPTVSETVSATSATGYGAAESSAPASYAERYSTQAETARPAMPRKVVPVERTFPAREENYNYPQMPTYRAPDAVKEPEDKRDFYAKDVTREPAAEENTVASASDSPAGEPMESLRLPYAAQLTDTPAASESSAPAAPTESDSGLRSPREMFRNAFSRSPQEEERPQPRFGFGSAAQEEKSEPDRGFGTSEVDVGSDRVERAFRELDSARGFGAPKREEPSVWRTDDAPREVEPTRETEDPVSVRRGFTEPEEPAEDSLRGRSAADLFDDDADADFDDADFRKTDEPIPPSRSFEALRESPRRGSMQSAPSPVREISDEPAPVPVKHVYKKYVCPNHNHFEQYNDTVAVSTEEIEHNSNVIVETLSAFHIEAEVAKVTCGSAVTRYDIDIPGNVAVRNVIKRDAEIALRLHARDGVNIYSNSEVGAISIEVPNSVRATVGLRAVMQSDEYVNGKPNSLLFAIGKDVEGRNVCGNIVKMKHLLVAGSTGSGKSVCLNAMLISLICKYSPEDLRLILIDPKKVEFAIFDGLPHLMINEIIADAQKAVTALNWAIKEMERRYSLFEQKTRSGANVHNLDEYNAHLTEDEEKLPKIVIVVDELADLMSVAKKDIEDRIQRLAQKARAAGMHLVIATQRPSVDVITGVIKGNLPTRLAFRVIQEVDSRTILDESGAEKLLGNGDMLYRSEGMFNCLRVQGAFISSREVQAVIEDIKAHNEAYFDESVADYINKNDSPAGGSDEDGEDDGKVNPQYIKALAIVVKLGSASISLIQRKCSIGYNHAGKIIEWMEMMHYISPFEGKAKPRTVLLSKEEFESKFGKLD